MPGVLTMENLRELYPEDKYILLLPQVSKFVQENRPMWNLDVAEVKIDPEDDNMVYTMKGQYEGNNYVATEVGLSRVSIDLLCSAADIDVDPFETPDSVQRADRMWRRFAARAIMRTPSGVVRSRVCHVEWDGEIMKEKVWNECSKYVHDGIRKGWAKFKNLDEAGIAAAVETRFSKEWLREREFGPRKAEGKAARNAASRILAMRSTYTVAELKQKKFAVVKFVFSPDTSDPEIKRMLIDQGMQATRQLYASGAARQIGGEFIPETVTDAPLMIEGGQTPPDDDDFSPAQNAGRFPAPADAEPETEQVEADPRNNWSGVVGRIPEITMGLNAMREQKRLPSEVWDAFEQAVKDQDANTVLDVELWWEEYK